MIIDRLSLHLANSSLVQYCLNCNHSHYQLPLRPQHFSLLLLPFWGSKDCKRDGCNMAVDGQSNFRQKEKTGSHNQIDKVQEKMCSGETKISQAQKGLLVVGEKYDMGFGYNRRYYYQYHQHWGSKCLRLVEHLMMSETEMAWTGMLPLCEFEQRYDQLVQIEQKVQRLKGQSVGMRTSAYNEACYLSEFVSSPLFLLDKSYRTSSENLDQPAEGAQDHQQIQKPLSSETQNQLILFDTCILSFKSCQSLT